MSVILELPTSSTECQTIVPFRPKNQSFLVTMISTLPPRKCGLATFTSDVVNHMGRHHANMRFELWAMGASIGASSGASGSKSSGAAFAGSITPQDPESYKEAAAAINGTDTDAVWLQHEFGIYGGPDGEMVLDLVDRIAAPLIVTFHTVLERPSDNQRRIIDHLVSRASRIMVMSPLSRDRLVGQHSAPREIVDIIEHGAPDRPFGREDAFKAARGLGTRPVLTTFGLLGPGKGLETVIEALPEILLTHPDVIYRIVGATHPNLIASEGEKYRDRLKDLAQTKGVAHAIEWEDRFLDTTQLLDQLEACDIYLTPYPNLQQSTSGTLSYAVALGKAVISTPYIHAQELLGDGVGVLVEPQSAAAIAQAVCTLLDDPVRLAAQKRRAYDRGRLTIWPRFAEAVSHMIERSVSSPPRAQSLREPSFDAIRRMSDSTGMLQHAIGAVPDRRHGYCLDDNVRALMLVNVATGISASERANLATIYAAFIQHSWNDDIGAFRNFMRFDRGWCEERGSEDSNGRAIWALARTAIDNPQAELRQWATRLYDMVLGHSQALDSPRTLAFVTLGASAMLTQRPGHEPSRAAVIRGAEVLAHLLDRSRRPDWIWFEAVVAYDNPRLPQALIAAGQALQRQDWIALGLETLEWICARQTAPGGHFRPIGSEGFGFPYDQMPFDQQPLEAQAAIDACAAAYAVDGAIPWRTHGMAAWQWFFGANDRGAVLADPDSGLCRDGVNPRGANLNCGAESILAFHLGYHSVLALIPGQAQDSGIRVDQTEQGGSRPVVYS